MKKPLMRAAREICWRANESRHWCRNVEAGREVHNALCLHNRSLANAWEQTRFRKTEWHHLFITIWTWPVRVWGVCVFECMCVCVYVHVRINVLCMNIDITIVFLCLQVYVYIYIYIDIMCVHVCMCVRVYECIHVSIMCTTAWKPLLKCICMVIVSVCVHFHSFFYLTYTTGQDNLRGVFSTYKVQHL